MLNQAIFMDSHSATSLLASEDGLSRSAWPAFPIVSRCGRVVRRASLSVWLEQESGKTIHVTWLRPFSISSENASLQESLASKLQTQLKKIIGLTPYLLSCQRKVTPAGLPYYQRQASVRRIKETDCSLAQSFWNTPAASDGTRGGSGITPKMTGSSLPQLVKSAAWSTPTANDYKGSGTTVIRKDGKDRTFDRLDYATEQGIAPGPSPCAQNGTVNGYRDPQKVIARKTAGRQQNLQDVVILAIEPSRVTASGQVLTGLDAEMGNSGQLNPEHSRWLMGFPPEWDDCAVMVMPSCRKRRRNS